MYLIQKYVLWSQFLEDLSVRIYLFQLHLFEMNQGVHIPFAWCVFRFIGVTYVLSSTSPSFSLKKVLKLFSISLTFISSVTGFIENEFRGREYLTQPEKKRLTAHTKVELFFRLLVYPTTRHWEHSHENEQYHRSEWHTVTKFKKKTSRNKQQATAAAVSNVPTCNTVRLHVFVCDIQGENRKTLWYVSFYRRKYFHLCFYVFTATLYDIQCLAVKCFSRQKMYLAVLCIQTTSVYRQEIANKRFQRFHRVFETYVLPRNSRHTECSPTEQNETTFRASCIIIHILYIEMTVALTFCFFSWAFFLLRFFVYWGISWFEWEIL